MARDLPYIHSIVKQAPAFDVAGQDLYRSDKQKMHDSWALVERGFKGVGLQPEDLVDRVLVKHYHPASDQV
eukprot:1159444-Pelagomonas_calceolata.AAC.6